MRASRPASFSAIAGAARAPADRRHARRGGDPGRLAGPRPAGAAHPARGADSSLSSSTSRCSGCRVRRPPVKGLPPASPVPSGGRGPRCSPATCSSAAEPSWRSGRPGGPHLPLHAGRRPARLARRGAQRRPRPAAGSAAGQGGHRLQRLDHRQPGGRLVIRRKRNRQLWSPTVAGSGWSESTLAEQAWEIERGAAVRWAIACQHLRLAGGPGAERRGGLAGEGGGLGDRPAAVARRCASQDLVRQRRAHPHRRRRQPRRELPCPEPRSNGRCRRGSTASAWPLRQKCCINGTMRLQIRPGLFGRIKATYAPPPGAGNVVGQWPSAWLGGLGTPWNTLQLGGTVQFASPGLLDRAGPGPLAARPAAR